jgi:hypothetical protein
MLLQRPTVGCFGCRRASPTSTSHNGPLQRSMRLRLQRQRNGGNSPIGDMSFSSPFRRFAFL